ncbi:TetR/AcrR family transcriptional regulator [Leptolinea tardivitalis]|uniref:TetR/AcrR family transcriptional regulator n=1 Tax=Leptolinea tardivitalis TaxID=229920 RepID=UPI0007866DFC|nr:TetR/AcrR family transcriptional regulator [Leptolinea tardivitalis]GAP21422.1 transcriptional regulator, TetR family [Leptolinea tardivitalis]
MPRGFTPTQTQNITRRLMDAAREMAQQTGVRKTSVESLTRAANISTGAFYHFFPSKEALFFRVFEELETSLKDEFLDLIEPLPHGDRSALKQAVMTMLSSEKMNRLVSFIRREEMDYLLLNLEPASLLEHQQSDREYMQQVLDILSLRGFRSTGDASRVNNYIQALFLLMFDRSQFQPDADRILSSFVGAMLTDLFG